MMNQNGFARHYPVGRQQFGDTAVTTPATDPNATAAALKPVASGFGIWAALATVSMAASAYHGYKRDQSVGWAIWWGLMGAMFPVITPTIAIAEGFGKRKSGR